MNIYEEDTTVYGFTSKTLDDQNLAMIPPMNLPLQLSGRKLAGPIQRIRKLSSDLQLSDPSDHNERRLPHSAPVGT